MEEVLDVIRVVNLFTAGILAGGQAFCLVALVRSLPEYDPAISAFVHQHSMTDRPHHFLRAVAVTVMLSAAALVVLLALDDQILPLAFTAAALAATIVSGAISSREWPINEEIKSWGAQPKLDRYAVLRRTWDSRHVKRTWLSLAAFVLFAVALVVAEAA